MTVNVELSPELQDAIDEKLRTGEFRSADDLVCVAIQRFIEDERESEREGTRIAGERKTGQD